MSLKDETISKHRIVNAIAQALQNENLRYMVEKAYANPCSQENCNLPAICKGFCNAHYLRLRKGADMSVPVRNRSNTENCIDCGKKVGMKGGFNRCTRHYKQRRLFIIKTALVRLFGGKCSKCEESFPVCVYDFHHLSDKKHSIGYLMGNGSIERIADEIKKCILLCSNCHRRVHHES